LNRHVTFPAAARLGTEFHNCDHHTPSYV